MLKQLVTILFLFSIIIGYSQTYSNSWINFNQSYYKIKVVDEGIYKLGYSTLANAGIPVSALDQRNFQIWNKGEEQYIYIVDNDNNPSVFGINDYIIFYGVPNDGLMDTIMFRNKNEQSNPYFSLINDTNVYFLTWNTSVSNRRMTEENDIAFSSYAPAAEYCIKRKFKEYKSVFYYGSEGSGPFFTAGEGWFDSKFGLNSTGTTSSATKNITLPGLYSSGPNIKINISLASISNYQHHLEITLPGTSWDSVFYGVIPIFKDFEILPSAVSSNSLSVSCSIINDQNALTDYNTISYIDIYYPHDYDFENRGEFAFYPPNSANGKTLVNITNFNGGTNPMLFDLTNHKKIKVVESSGTYYALIPNSTEDKMCYILSADSISTINSLDQVSFHNYLVEGFNSDYLIISHPLLWQSAQQYQTYRNSTGYNCFLADINDLYNQFGYGISKHPFAIREFVRFIYNEYDSLPEYLFLLGKSIKIDNFKGNYGYLADSITLVPTIGNPGCDMLLTCGIVSSKVNPAMATGRLAAFTNEEVEHYLEKVIDYESNEPAEWMKNVAHFRGGTTTQDQQLFESYLNNMKIIIEDTLFGAYVSTFRKNSSAPMVITQSDSVRNLINNGLTLMTFFGHGTSSVFDYSIEEPSDYSNYKKYPLILANSCLSGDIHQFSHGLSEKWVLIGDKGAIGFLASSDEAYAIALNSYSSELYKQFAYKNYHGTFGKSILNTTRLLVSQPSELYINAALEFTFHGDPGIVINGLDKPDYIIETASISTIPAIVSTELDSIQVQVIVKNIGKAISGNIYVKLSRYYDGSTSGTPDEVYYKPAQVLYRDTLIFNIPTNKSQAIGLNSFCAYADFNGQVDEYYETNNEACLQTNIISTDLLPIWPYEYAIYPHDTVVLKASTGNPFLTNQTSVYQIDTNDMFLSPLYSGSVTHNGGVVEMPVPFNLIDSTVYYWRVAKSGSSNWRESSFIYIPGKTGWSQAHHFQFKKDEYKFIDYVRTPREFDYILTPKELHCQNIGSANSSQWWDVFYDIDGDVRGRTSSGAVPALLIAVINPVTLESWTPDIADFGHNNYPNYGSGKYFVFWLTDTTSYSDIENMLLNEVPDDYYILAYTFINGYLDQWPPSLYQAFATLNPSTSISSYPGNYPFIFFCQKGNTSTATEIIGNSATDTINLYVSLPTNYTSGNITSTVAGPAGLWHTFHWKQKSFELPDNDTMSLSLIGIKLNGVEDTLLKLDESTTDVYDLYTSIDAQVYPYLKLDLYCKDDSSKTPPQLKKWQLTYDEMPETAINYDDGFYFYQDTVLEGDNVSFAIATRNISPYDMDSLLVKYWHQDKNNNIQVVKTARLRPHPAWDVLIDTVVINTAGYPGLNSLWVEYNPVNDQTGNYDQLEQYHFNNYAQIFFYVESDNINPLLDVTFDGIHILDGDIVSADPEILIQLKDENKFLALNDLSLFQISLKYPDASDETIITEFDSLGNQRLFFTPAKLPDNSCKVLFKPGKLPDGIYELKVNATDVSNNLSGDYSYDINFEVINASTITNVFNYPNPFSTSTRFVFELTGSEIPTDFQIMIFTITGKLVKVISLDDLGNIHIGRNITEYAWDGTDMYGDKLANGVYFYKVTARINGEDIDKRDTGTDKFFKHNIGKLYIMR
ncbi:MAG: hypothetical protein Kow0068_07040 [Marinilabiliales bacterium]